jgi:excisionase family DNA binding protein
MIKHHKGQYMTSLEAAQLLGLTQDYVRKLILQGKIKALKLGHNWLCTRKAIKHIKRQRFPRDKEK